MDEDEDFRSFRMKTGWDRASFEILVETAVILELKHSSRDLVKNLDILTQDEETGMTGQGQLPAINNSNLESSPKFVKIEINLDRKMRRVYI